MGIFKIPTALVFALATSAMTMFAQWPSYPTPGPRTTEGKIDFAAPPPRMANGKPDFSGLWEPAHTADSKNKGLNDTSPLPFAIPSSPDDSPVAQFFNIGAGFKDGLLPFTAWGAQVRAQ